MTLIIEDGTGLLRANAYISIPFATAHLASRGLIDDWSAATTAQKEAAIINGTAYIDRRFGLRFKGTKLYYENLSTPAEAWGVFTTLPSDSDDLTIGGELFTFKTSASLPTDVEIGADIASTIQNLIDNIAGRDLLFTGISWPGNVIQLITVATGSTVENIEIVSTTDSVLFSSNYIEGASDDGSQSLEFPRSNLVLSTGAIILGVPANVKKACAEYAYRSLTESLMPDPVVDETGGQIRRKFEKVGPIEQETAFAVMSSAIFKKFPEVDRLLFDYLGQVGGVYR